MFPYVMSLWISLFCDEIVSMTKNNIEQLKEWLIQFTTFNPETGIPTKYIDFYWTILYCILFGQNYFFIQQHIFYNISLLLFYFKN